ncbi:MAG: flagellar biosynthesis anti-sigma factor FlgM [Planctomycetota bacterium]|nr:flagellar biosynthesis anti-sigma factor FlgM [Planctomycetota bacterium]
MDGTQTPQRSFHFRPVDVSRSTCPSHRRPEPATARWHPPVRPADRLGSRLKSMSSVRQELVERVRREIAAGTYETAEKMDVAVGKLAEDLM